MGCEGCGRELLLPIDTIELRRYARQHRLQPAILFKLTNGLLIHLSAALSFQCAVCALEQRAAHYQKHRLDFADAESDARQVREFYALVDHLREEHRRFMAQPATPH